MSFVSYSFVAFVLLCLLLYYILPQKFRWIILLLSSYIFYFLFVITLFFSIQFIRGWFDSEE